jgi:hypothetical protein
LQYGQTSNPSQEDLANFGYRPDMKVNDNIVITLFSLPAGTCYTNLEGFFFFFFGEIRAIFQKSPLYMSNHTF